MSVLVGTRIGERSRLLMRNCALKHPCLLGRFLYSSSGMPVNHELNLPTIILLAGNLMASTSNHHSKAESQIYFPLK